MALPTLVKTWQFSVNQAIAAQGTAKLDNARAIRLAKDALLAFATNPWLMRYSCNSTTAGTAGDGVDRLTTDASFVWNAAGSAHSWMVIRQTGIAANYEVCISCESASTPGGVLAIVVSPSAGFTGGSTTARPTATDEVIVLASTSWTSVATDIATRLSVMQSTDGQCTRVIGAASGALTFMWVFDRPANPTAGWSNPSVSVVQGANVGLASQLSAAGSALAKMRSGSTNGNVVLTCEGNSTGIIPTDAVFGNVANEISSEWPMIPIGFESYTVGVRGRHGTLQDIWYGSSSVATGDTYPNDSSNQFAQFGNIILPWNGGAVNLT